MITLAFGSLIALLLQLLRRYGLSAIAHPGLWYSLAWLSAFICYFGLEAAGGVPIEDPELLDNLASFVAFGAATFCLLTLLPPKRGYVGGHGRRVVSAVPSFLLVFGLTGLIGALINWAALGAPLGYDDSLRQQWLTEIPVVTARMWYLYLLSFPAAIVAGRGAALWILFEVKLTRRQKLLLATPFAAGFFWSLATGGRQAFGFVVLYYIAGGVLAVVARARQGDPVGLRRLLRASGMALAVLLTLAVFVGLTGQSRANQQGSLQASVFDDYWYLAPIGQFIAYNGLAIATHQVYGKPAPRDLHDTGPVTLAGLQSFGLRLFTGWRAPTVQDTNPERALESRGLALATATRNVFYDLQADFGYHGAFVATATLVLISQLFFTFSGGIGSGRLLPVTPLVTSLFFWGYSHQFSLLMFNTFAWLALGCFLWDVANGFFRIRRRHSPAQRAT